MTTRKELLHELRHHLPFTLFATTLGILLVLTIQFLLKSNISQGAFEIFHPLHVIVSGLVSAGIFYKYNKKIMPALLVGIFSAITIGTISDVFFPFLGGKLLFLDISFHLPLIEKPLLILGSALLGSMAGIKLQKTKIPHSIHVFLSVFASLFYLMAFAPSLSIVYLILSVIIVSLAVVIPCCMSDILLPFFFLGKKIKTCSCQDHC